MHVRQIFRCLYFSTLWVKLSLLNQVFQIDRSLSVDVKYNENQIINIVISHSPVLPKKASPNGSDFDRGNTLRNMQINHPVKTMSLALLRLIFPYLKGYIKVRHLINRERIFLS